MRLRALGKWILELVFLYAGWRLLESTEDLFVGLLQQTPVAPSSQVLGIIGVSAIVGAAILGTLLVQDLVRRVRGRTQPHQGAQQLQVFLGVDELLRELERVEASCGRLSGSLAASGRDVNLLIMELDHLWIALMELEGKYHLWPLSLRNKVTMVVDQIREASSVLSEKDLDLEHVKAHIDGAVQNVQALVAYLKSPPTS
jgi:hypothetical protein